MNIYKLEKIVLTTINNPNISKEKKLKHLKEVFINTLNDIENFLNIQEIKAKEKELFTP